MLLEAHRAVSSEIALPCQFLPSSKTMYPQNFSVFCWKENAFSFQSAWEPPAPVLPVANREHITFYQACCAQHSNFYQKSWFERFLFSKYPPRSKLLWFGDIVCNRRTRARHPCRFCPPRSAYVQVSWARNACFFATQPQNKRLTIFANRISVFIVCLTMSALL